MECHAPSYITLGAILVKYSVPRGRVIAERKVIYRFSAHDIHQLDSSILLDEAEKSRERFNTVTPTLMIHPSIP